MVWNFDFEIYEAFKDCQYYKNNYRLLITMRHDLTKSIHRSRQGHRRHHHGKQLATWMQYYRWPLGYSGGWLHWKVAHGSKSLAL